MLRFTRQFDVTEPSTRWYCMTCLNHRTRITKGQRLPPGKQRPKLRSLTRRRRLRRPRTFPASKRRSVKRTLTPIPLLTMTAATKRKVGDFVNCQLMSLWLTSLNLAIPLGEKPKQDEAKEENDVKDDKGEKEAEKTKSPAEEKKDDGKLMPPPSVIPAKPKAEPEPTPSSSKPAYRPLAGMLPEKYKDVDVKELFPEFRHNQVRVMIVSLSLIHVAITEGSHNRVLPPFLPPIK